MEEVKGRLWERLGSRGRRNSFVLASCIEERIRDNMSLGLTQCQSVKPGLMLLKWPGKLISSHPIINTKKVITSNTTCIFVKEDKDKDFIYTKLNNY